MSLNQFQLFIVSKCRLIYTDSGGHYGIGVRLGPGTHTIEAHYAGDSDHESSSATKVIPVTP
ncbi:MAG: Ig-like domain-containing protein [Candidatus Nitrosopolaris sp.]